MTDQLPFPECEPQATGRAFDFVSTPDIVVGGVGGAGVSIPLNCEFVPDGADPGKIGQRILRARELAGLSQTELADEASIGQTSISRYENGFASPGADSVVRLCRALRVSADWLLGVSG